MKKKTLKELLHERILVLDGAMGTALQKRNLKARDFGGEALEGCNENLVFTRPDVISEIHSEYFSAGSDIVETNTFGATPLVLAEYGLADKAQELNKVAARLARRAAEEFTTSAKPRFVAGSMGPTTKAITVTGGVTFAELIENFRIQTLGLIEGGVDLLLLETCQDTRNIKAATVGIHQAFAETEQTLPLIISGTIEPMGTMLAGQTAEALVASLMHLDLLAIGLNCATGPEFMTDHIRSMHEIAPWGISCYPNAGLPNEEGAYGETPESLARQLEKFVDHGWVNLLGGCCGTTEKHIAAIAAMVEEKKPRRWPKGRPQRSFYTGIDLVEATDDNRPLIVGERTNVIGSRLFKNLVNDEKWEEATDIARRQVRHGAQVIDVCLQSTDRDELPDIDPFYDKLIRKIKAPLMIDTTDPQAVAKALTYCQGKSIINSVNLEDGEEKFANLTPLVHQFGAALIVGCIDEDPQQAQAFTRERKLAIAERSHELLTRKYGMAEEDLIFDPLVFPCATGDENYIGGPVETIEGLILIKERFPHCKTTLGVSNISFGLPPAAREVVNSVFLYHATRAGLDLAIVNSEKLQRFASLAEDERKMAEDLLFNHPPEVSPGHPEPFKNVPRDWREQSPEQRAAVNQANIARVTAFYRHAAPKAAVTMEELPLDERLARYILEGSKDGLVADLDRKRAEGAKPLDIINGPLMAGMSEVGRLFNKNELIVAEVLQSAEAMKAAVNHLEQFMEKSEVVAKGKVVLATVKGDVHDIGKNLVEIILANNGYEVINLGIKVPSDQIIQAVKQHQPDMIGLSGLLVKSAQQMSLTAGDLRESGIALPLLVGGAALSDKFTRNKIAPSYTHAVFYAKDAMTGLDLANRLMDPMTREALLEKGSSEKGSSLDSGQDDLHVRSLIKRPVHCQDLTPSPSSRVRTDLPIPSVPSLERRVRDVPQLKEIWSYINPQMLYSKHLGFKGNFMPLVAQRDPKALKLKEQVAAVMADAEKWMKIRAVWQFFPAESEGNQLHLFAPQGQKPLHTFTFPRVAKPDGLCLADFVLPPRALPDGTRRRDHVALFVVTAGEGVREQAEAAKQAHDFLKSHIVQALALESAEAAAEWLHRRLREDWGFPDPSKLTMEQRFRARYQGKRYSFGYPACPELADQEGLFKLLRPEDIGVQLTEGQMMDPEASVSALVFHHPDCCYFNVGTGGE